MKEDKNQDRLPLTAHYLTNEQIWVDGDRAKAKWMFYEPAVHKGAGAILIAGRYDNDFQRIDGKWLISHLRCQDIFVCTYEDGWEGVSMRGDRLGSRRRVIGLAFGR